MTEFAAFVTEPEANATIYHLSRDDTKALCGRDVSRMICIGGISDTMAGRLLQELYPLGYVVIRRCCVLCKGKVKKNSASAKSS